MRQFLDTTSLSLDELPSIDAALFALRRYIKDFRATLNDEGIWLFLSTVGCWGVPQPAFQIAAYVLTIFLFGKRMSSRHIEQKSFSKLASDLESRINASAGPSEIRTRHLLELVALRQNQLSGWKALKHAGPFLFSWLFYGASFFYALITLVCDRLIFSASLAETMGGDGDSCSEASMGCASCRASHVMNGGCGAAGDRQQNRYSQ
jgi:hypothetical protein